MWLTLNPKPSSSAARRPAVPRGAIGCSTGGKGSDGFVLLGEGGGIGRLRIGGDAGLVDPFLETQFLLAELVVFDEIRTDVGKDNRRGDRLKGVAVEITLEVSVEFITSDGGFDHPQESGAGPTSCA